MLSLGIGLNEMQRVNMERWGSLTMIRVQQGMIFDDKGQPLKEGKQLNDEAVDELRSLEGVLAVSPVYSFGGEASFGRKRGGLSLIGLDASSMKQLEFTAEQGRLLDEGDRNVMVIGREVINNFRDEAFIRQMRKGMGMEGMMNQEEQDPGELLNQRISITLNAGEQNNKRLYSYTVIGILEGERTEHSYQAYIPIEDLKRMRDFASNGNARSSSGMIIGRTQTRVTSTAANRRNTTQRNSDDYDYILVRTKNVEESQKASLVIKDLGYNTWSMADQLEGIEKTSRTIQAILGGIGSITLLVAALGITNTMIMSIYERTREIGIMKVIGASFNDIYKMFLTEAGLIGFFGGIFGLGFSYIVSYIINRLSAGFMNQGMAGGETASISVIPVWLTLFAVLFSVLVGLLAGIYPAYRAVRLSPINAIRNE
jgi:ABC-type antimicrobial peptide transport system permease subunit